MGQKLLWLSVAGAAGTLARYGLAALVQKWHSGAFPWGTLIVNGLGCFLFGLVWCLAAERRILTDETRLLMLVGFMGAFTTFSTFAFETGEMIREARWGMAAANILAQNLLGLLSFFAGVAAAQGDAPLRG